jgi:hypothetical protein
MSSRSPRVVVMPAMPSAAIVTSAAAPLATVLVGRLCRPAPRVVVELGAVAGRLRWARRWRARASRTGAGGRDIEGGSDSTDRAGGRAGGCQRPSRALLHPGGGWPGCHRWSASSHQPELESIYLPSLITTFSLNKPTSQGVSCPMQLHTSTCDLVRSTGYQCGLLIPL